MHNNRNFEVPIFVIGFKLVLGIFLNYLRKLKILVCSNDKKIWLLNKRPYFWKCEMIWWGKRYNQTNFFKNGMALSKSNRLIHSYRFTFAILRRESWILYCPFIAQIMVRVARILSLLLKIQRKMGSIVTTLHTLHHALNFTF